MRRNKFAAQQRANVKITQHTRPERLALRRKKRKEGPAAKRRAERRKAKQESQRAIAVALSTPVEFLQCPFEDVLAVPFAKFTHEAPTSDEQEEWRKAGTSPPSPGILADVTKMIETLQADKGYGPSTVYDQDGVHQRQADGSMVLTPYDDEPLGKEL